MLANNTTQVLLDEAEMRALILAFADGLAFAASTQAAPVWRNTAGIEFGAGPLMELVRDGCGRTRLAPEPLARPVGLSALAPLYSERGSARHLERRLEPSLIRLARSLWGLE